MKYFIKKIILFISLFFIVVVFIFFINITHNKIVNKIRLQDGLLIAGHSHTRVGIIPDSFFSLFSPVVNKSDHGRSLFWTIQNIKCQPSYKNIIIGYSNNNLTTESWTFESYWMLIQASRSIFGLEMKDWKYLLINNFTRTIRMFLTTPMFFEPVKGDFEANFRDKLLYEIKHTKRIKSQHYRLDTIDFPVVFRQLEEFIRLNSDKRFFIVRSPMHKLYFDILGEECNEDLYLHSLNILSRLENVIVLDFGHLTMTDDCFADLDHLNFNGAKKFSHLLKMEILEIINKIK